MQYTWGITNKQVYYNYLTKLRKKGILLKFDGLDIVNPDIFPKDWHIKVNTNNEE